MGARLADGANSSVAARYAAMVADGAIDDDPAQRALAARLDVLCAALRADVRPSLLGRLTGRRAAPPRGLYLYGDVGRGKTMLMDAFFACAPVAAKRRVHFDAFMGEMQDRIHAARAAHDGDPIAPVAAEVAQQTRLLCLDEFAVTDIADAMILSRLFTALFADGLVLVATSNTPPDDLYRDGLNRALFMPFLDVLRRHVDVVRLDVDTDYRLRKLAGTPVYLMPADARAKGSLDRIWWRLTGTDHGAPTALRTRGRDIRIPEAAEGVARFAFNDLCRQPLGGHDYLQIARAFHTVMVDGIPKIADGERDVARRFILLVDALYDHHVNLIASAAVAPEGLYTAASGEEAFAFRRTVSRLVEMQSDGYLAAPHGAVVSSR